MQRLFSFLTHNFFKKRVTHLLIWVISLILNRPRLLSYLLFLLYFTWIYSVHFRIFFLNIFVQNLSDFVLWFLFQLIKFVNTRLTGLFLGRFLIYIFLVGIIIGLNLSLQVLYILFLISNETSITGISHIDNKH